MKTYLEDVLYQPESLKKCLNGLMQEDNLNKLNRFSSMRYSKIVFSGMGSSNYCSYGASILLSQNGITNMRLSASELLHYELPIIDEGTLLVLISQSGESAEIVNLIGKLPPNSKVVAVTNDPNSTLARRGDITFLMNVEEEEAVTTRTYLASIVICYLIAFALTNKDIHHFEECINKGIEALKTVLLTHEQIVNRMLGQLGIPPYLFLLGRGGSMSTVEAGVLFMREIVKYPAMGLNSGEFKHGPMEMVDGRFHGIIIAPEKETRNLSEKLALSIVQKGGKVVFVTTGEAPEEKEGLTVILLPAVETWLSPLVSIVPVQLYAERLAVKLGIEAGKFRWGSKIMAEE